MARNFDVNLCPVGAIGFYFLYRFHNSNEMDDLNFCDNSTWFDIKLLTRHDCADITNCILDTLYAAAVKKVCVVNNIPTAHYAHIGRVLSAF